MQERIHSEFQYAQGLPYLVDLFLHRTLQTLVVLLEISHTSAQDLTTASAIV